MVSLEKLIGETVDGKYDIIEEIGRGAMGIVYRANLKALHKEVAFKVLHKRYSHDEKYVKRFQSEAKIASSLGRHPNVAYVYGSGKVGNLYYIVMEYLPGDELFSLMHGKNRPDLSESVSLFLQACQGLAFIHEKGIVHRDLKPGNLMFSVDGNLKITDFGIACGEDSGEDKAEKGGPGTPKYMSPEQIKGEQGDVRSDIYSMGIMLYEMVTGKIPYPADTVQDLIMKVMTQAPVPAKSVNPKISDVLEAAIMKSIQKDKNNRFQSVAEFANAVAASIGRDAPVMVDTSHKSFLQSLVWYHWALAAVAAAALAAGMVLIFAPDKSAGPGDPAQTPATGGVKQPVEQPVHTTSPEEHVRILEKKALESIEKHNLAEATAFLTEALEEYDAKDYNCNLLLGEVLQKRGRIQDSLKQYEKLHNLYPKEKEVLSRLGQGFMSIEFYLPAITFFEKFLKLNPDDAGATLDLGLAYLKWAEEAVDEGDKESIIEERTVKGLSSLNKVTEKMDLAQRPEVLQYMIKGYVRMGKNKEARQLIQKLPEERGVSPQIWESLGMNSLDNQYYQQAILELREAVKKKEASPECWQALAKALIKGRQSGSGDVFFAGDEVLTEAINAFQQGNVTGETPESLKMLGWAQVEYAKDNEDGIQPAMETCEKLKQVLPDDDEIQAWLPALYEQSDNLDKLIGVYKEQMGQAGADAGLSSQLAETLLEKARQTKNPLAREELLLELLQYERLDEAIDLLVQIYRDRAAAEPDQMDKLPYLDKIIELRDSPEARKKAADIFVAAGLKSQELATKYRHYQKALEYDSQHRAATHNMVVVMWYYFKGSKTIDERIGWLREIRKIKPKDKQAVTWLLKLLMEKIKSTEDETEKRMLLKEAQGLEMLIK